MSGWIKIHRDCLDHWLYNEYRPLTKREAWENILLWANFDERKVLIRGQLIDCKRGQLLYSIDTYAEKFVWSASQVRTFFDLLKKDGMIKCEGLKYTTRLTVCNYDYYQDLPRTESELKTNSLRTDCELTANSSRQDKNSKNEKEKSILSEKSNFPKSEKSKPFSEIMNADNTKILFDDLEWQSKILAYGCTARELSKYLTEFQSDRYANGDQNREVNDLKKYFLNWVKIKISKSKENANKRKDRFNVPIPDYNAETTQRDTNK